MQRAEARGELPPRRVYRGQRYWSEDDLPQLRAALVERVKRGRPLVPELVAEMRQLRAAGMSYRQVAARVGVAPMTVYKWCRDGAEGPSS